MISSARHSSFLGLALAFALSACSAGSRSGTVAETAPASAGLGGTSGKAGAPTGATGATGAATGNASIGGALALPLRSGALRVGTSALPAAFVGVPYEARLRAAGGSGQTTWRVASGALPAGLTLSAQGSDALLAGVVNQAALTPLTIEAVDALGDVAQAAFTLESRQANSVLYVDAQLSATTTAYDPQTRAGNGGSSAAYPTLSGGAGAAQPGDLVLIRAGTFSETLAPQRSGTAAAPITYRVYPGEVATISNPSLQPGIELSGRSYLRLDGITVDGVRRWLYARRSHENVLLGCSFLRCLDPGGSQKAGVYFEEATRNRILDCVLEGSTQDNLSLIKSDRNLVQGCTIRKAAHALWVIKGGTMNVVRGNYFHNALQKIGEVYDPWDVGFNHQFFEKDVTKRHLIEDNEFAFTPSSGNKSPYSGIQYAGQQGILRGNRFYDTMGPGLRMANYGDEAMNNTDNRVYGNVFYGTDFAGISISPNQSANHTGNVYKNNVLARSAFVANDTRWRWYTGELAGKPVQLLTGRLTGLDFENNCFFDQTPGQAYTITYGRRDRSNNWPTQHDVSWWEQNYPALFRGNLEHDPSFVDAAAKDFRLRASSQLVDAGAFLTTTAAAGSGARLTVADASYFFDGFGIPGEVGDLVQLEGQTAAARVVSIDYAQDTLTLDRSLSWSAGLGVALRYAGAAPDVGAHERP